MEDLLFLSHRIPYPPNKGDKIRSWHILEHLAGRYRVHLGCLYDDPDDAEHIPFLGTVCATVCCRPLHRLTARARSLTGLLRGEPLTVGYFRDEKLGQWVADTVRSRNPSRAFIFCSAMANYIRDDRSSIRILDMIDLDSEKWRQYAEKKPVPMKQLYAREYRLLRSFERNIAGKFDATLFVSDPEAQRLRAIAPEASARIQVLSNGVDLEYFEPRGIYTRPFSGDGPFAVFTGAMDYWPNVQAVVWFANEVLPTVRTRWSDAQFWIVGRDPANVVRRLARPGMIHVTGKVNDIRPYIAHASVIVAPLQIACGVQNKVLEAMAMGKIVIASPSACEGIKVQNQKDILIAETAEEFAAAIDEVVAHRAGPLGIAARARIERDYRWNFAILDRLLDEPAQLVVNAR